MGPDPRIRLRLDTPVGINGLDALPDREVDVERWRLCMDRL